MSTSSADFVISRTFDAPLSLVWEAFSDPDQLVKWWGPKGFAMTNHGFDFSAGGKFVYRMTTGNNEMWGRFVFREIVPQQRVVFVNSFSNPEGEITRAPFMETFPLEVLLTLTFQADGDRTTLHLLGQPLDATDEELAAYRDMHASMRMGFGNALDELEIVLAQP